MWVLIKYIKAIFKNWAQVFIATIGFVASLVLFLPGLQLETASSKIAALAICFLLSAVVITIMKPIRQAVENLLLNEILFSEDYSAKILFPYKEKYLKPLNTIANTYYGKSSANEQYIKTWYEKNSYSLVTLADRYGVIIGYYDMLPLVENFALDFIDGKVSEKDIRASHILCPQNMRDAQYIYFAGVAIKNQHTQQSKIFAGYLLYSAFLYLKKFYDLESDKVIFATAATDSGKRLLIHLDFKLENSKLNRKDKLDLYAKTINTSNIDLHMEKIISFGAKVDYSDLENASL